MASLHPLAVPKALSSGLRLAIGPLRNATRYLRQE